jgi:putative acetyltransferase
MSSEIIIRHRESRDLDDLYEVHQGARYIWGTLQLPHTSIETVRKRIETRTDGLTALVAEIDGKVVGQLGLVAISRPRRKHVGTIGMGVHDDYAGRGVGSALMAACVDMADNWLNLSRLELEAFTDNVAAIGLYKKFGFVEEGIKKAHAFRSGKFVDTLSMARFRPDFLEKLRND